MNPHWKKCLFYFKKEKIAQNVTTVQSKDCFQLFELKKEEIVVNEIVWKLTCLW